MARSQKSEIIEARLRRSRLYSEELGIHLNRRRDSDYFRWFLASALYGGRIGETIAARTYRAFVHHGLVTPRKIVTAGRHFLVNPIMREGGYVRYDGRKSTQIVRDCERLLEHYGGRLSRLHELATDSDDLERRLQEFYGVGPITANIFLRELRPYWRKARPEPLPVVLRIARQLGIDLGRHRPESMAFVRIEAGLIRLRHVRQLPSWPAIMAAIEGRAAHSPARPHAAGVS
jgi:endonuclease III